jgi:hypothetical protein
MSEKVSFGAGTWFAVPLEGGGFGRPAYPDVAG